MPSVNTLKHASSAASTSENLVCSMLKLVHVFSGRRSTSAAGHFRRTAAGLCQRVFERRRLHRLRRPGQLRRRQLCPGRSRRIHAPGRHSRCCNESIALSKPPYVFCAPERLQFAEVFRALSKLQSDGDLMPPARE